MIHERVAAGVVILILGLAVLTVSVLRGTARHVVETPSVPPQVYHGEDGQSDPGTLTLRSRAGTPVWSWDQRSNALSLLRVPGDRSFQVCHRERCVVLASVVALIARDGKKRIGQ